MKAYLRSVRIAPKKANIIAKMVRGMPVGEAIYALGRTNKKGARMVEQLVKSAIANAEHNDKQDSSNLVIKTIVVNQSMGYRRGIPMARGRTRPITKFLSHISVTLGVDGAEPEKKTKKAAPKAEKSAKSPSQNAKNQVKTSGTKPKSTEASPDSSSSADTSASSATS